MIVCLFMTAMLVATAIAEPVDKDVFLLANGNILTMNPNQPAASAMAVKEGKILAVGDLVTVKETAGTNYEYVDLEGKTVVPGFIETHDHLVLYGSALHLLDISPIVTPSLKEALAKFRAEGKPDKDGWYYGFGADQTLYTEKRGPTLKELDELFPDHPALITHLSGHAAYANSKAFEAAGITKDKSGRAQ